MTSAARHLLVLGWYRPGTGFTRVLASLLPFLAQRFRVTWYGVGYRRERFEPLPGAVIAPTNLHGGDMVGAHAVAEEWRTLAPDAVLALNDLWYLKHYSDTLAPIRGKVPMVGYAPLDGLLDDPRWLAPLAGFSTLVTYTESAANNLRAVAESAQIALPIAVAGHGVDTSAFRPLTASLQEKMQLAQTHFGLSAPAFVVLNAARPDPRKRIDLTLAGFAQFAQQRPDAYLCLHHAIHHPGSISTLRAQADALGISERVLFWPPQPGPLSDNALNLLYNACAVGINTAHGEGFGLVSFEHAATGAPQVIPAQAALLELWQSAAMFLPAKPARTPHSPLLMIEVDPVDVAASLTALRDENHWRAMSSAAQARANDPQFAWSQVAAQVMRFL